MQKKMMKLMMLTAVLVCLAFILGNCFSTSPAPAPRPQIDTLYVKASGSDSNSGASEDAAFQTFGKAWWTFMETANDNITIVVIGEIQSEYRYGYFVPISRISDDTKNIKTMSMRRLTITGKPNASESERAVLRGSGEGRIFNFTKGIIASGFLDIRLEHITITGGNAGEDKDGGAISVNIDVALTLGPGAVITGNQAVNGGGIALISGKLSIEGGEIRDNIASNNGGGVYAEGGTLTIKNGKIDGNQAQSGGGVYATKQAEFVLEGGEIANNLAISSEILNNPYVKGGKIETVIPTSGYGGGIAAFNLTMKGGTVTGNTVNGGLGQGAAIAVLTLEKAKAGTFVMEGGEIIANNTATLKMVTSFGKAGGNTQTPTDIKTSETTGNTVYVLGNMTMRNGRIADNPTGIFIEGTPVAKAVFMLEGGEITGNKGIGVGVGGYASWTMRGGKISENITGASIVGAWDLSKDRDGNFVTVSKGVCSFTMRGGEITNNRDPNADNASGLVYTHTTVTLAGGRIENNTIKGGKVGNVYESK